MEEEEVVSQTAEEQAADPGHAIQGVNGGVNVLAPGDIKVPEGSELTGIDQGTADMRMNIAKVLAEG